MNPQKKEISFDRFVDKYQRFPELPKFPLDYNEEIVWEKLIEFWGNTSGKAALEDFPNDSSTVSLLFSGYSLVMKRSTIEGKIHYSFHKEYTQSENIKPNPLPFESEAVLKN